MPFEFSDKLVFQIALIPRGCGLDKFGPRLIAREMLLKFVCHFKVLRKLLGWCHPNFEQMGPKDQRIHAGVQVHRFVA